MAVPVRLARAPRRPDARDLPDWADSPRSELTRTGAAIARFLDPASLERLQREALAVHRNAAETRVDVANDGQAGDPDRWLESSPGGPQLESFYRSPRVLDLLRQLTGVHWQPSGLSGAYSYYRRAGHHLGLHRDIDACELAAITCLLDDAAGDPGMGGRLNLYPSRRDDSLAEIRRSPEHGAIGLRLQPGETLLLLGGIVPHQLMPLGADHVRIIAPLCYRVLAASAETSMSSAALSSLRAIAGVEPQ